VPLDRHPAVVDAGERVLDRVPVADQRAVTVLYARLPPTHISAEERDIAAPRNEGFDIVSHFLRPVFVMPAADQELVVGEQRRIGVQIDARAELRADSRGDHPLNNSKIILAGGVGRPVE